MTRRKKGGLIKLLIAIVIVAAAIVEAKQLILNGRSNCSGLEVGLNLFEDVPACIWKDVTDWSGE